MDNSQPTSTGSSKISKQPNLSNAERSTATSAPSSSSQAPASPTSSSTPAHKCLIVHARNLPKTSHIWIQGVIVGISLHDQVLRQLVIDDGSALAVVQVNPKRHKTFTVSEVKIGSYLMATGSMSKRFKGFKIGLNAFTVRDLSSNAAFSQMLWNLEVVDAYLYHHETQRQGQQELQQLNQ